MTSSTIDKKRAYNPRLRLSHWDKKIDEALSEGFSISGAIKRIKTGRFSRWLMKGRFPKRSSWTDKERTHLARAAMRARARAGMPDE